MPPATKAIKHSRVGPEMDVAMCGERGSQLVFSPSMAGISCRVCKVRRLKAMENPRVKREAAARKAFFKAQGIA